MFKEVSYIINTFFFFYFHKISGVIKKIKTRNKIILDNVLKLTQVDELNILR